MSKRSKDLQLALQMEKLAAESNKTPAVRNAQHVLLMLRTLESDLRDQHGKAASMVSHAVDQVSAALELIREPDRKPTQQTTRGTVELRRFKLDNGHTVSVVRDTSNPHDLWEFAVLESLSTALYVLR